jgi:hypothetical protein
MEAADETPFLVAPPGRNPPHSFAVFPTYLKTRGNHILKAERYKYE